MTFEPITSTKNPLVQRLRSLSDRKGREAYALMLVEGEKMICEALRAALRPAVFFYDGSRAADFQSLVDALYPAGAEIHPVASHVLIAVCDTKTPQGCCAAFSLPEPERRYPSRLIALDGVQDPGNVGTIWRTADASGFQGLLLGAPSADPLSPKVQRASMGSGFRLPYWATEDLPGLLNALGADGYRIIVSALDGAPYYAHAPVGDKYVLVIGSEARGVSEAVSSVATMRLKLPMRGDAESLNAAIAAAVMMYDLTRVLPD